VSLLIAGIVIYPFCALSEDAFLRQLQAELAKRGDPWIAGETSVSHLSWEEKQRLCGILPISSEEKQSIKAKSTRTQKVNPPTELDWRNYDGYNWMTSVKDQQTCGSCWAFAWVAVQEARINIFNLSPTYNANLSEQYVVSCNPNGWDCSGGMCDFGDWVMEYGIPDEACYPYLNDDPPCSPCLDWQERAKDYKITDWGRGGANEPVEEIKALLMEGPISIHMDIKEDFFYYKGGVYEPIMGRDISNGKFNHAVCCVGWKADGRWIFKNSWGEDYGENGYGYVNSIGYPGWVIPEFLAVVKYVSNVIDDSIGNNNDEINANEQVEIMVKVRAAGKEDTTIYGVAGELKVVDPYITVVQGSTNFGNITAGDTVQGSIPFRLNISSGTPIPHPFACTLICRANSSAWKSVFNLTVVGTALIWTTDSLSFIFEQKTLTQKDTIQDTIQYDDGSDAKFIVGNNYWGAKFTTPKRCRVVGGMIRRKSSQSETDTLMLRDDVDGHPGPVIDRIRYTTGTGTNWYKRNFTGNYFDSDSFWLCYYARTAPPPGTQPAVVGDASGGTKSYFSTNGSVWQSMTYYDSDLLIRAIISYEAGTGEITVKNLGTGTLKVSDVNVAQSSNWIKEVGPITFNIAVGDSKKVSVVVDTVGLQRDVMYRDTIVVVSNTGKNETRVPVRLLIGKMGIEEEQETLYPTFSLFVTPTVKNKVEIRYFIPKKTYVRLKAYDITGREVAEILDKEEDVGVKKVEWDAKNMSSGIYFIRFIGTDFKTIKKIVIF
ncbi:MAG: T9SS type A sorting domain-containing protein, partial [Candidatus Stahlbacteria bacterium]|nr:T9SS type A sorting domain-containing protein [Candidatus Stahlbacteria bacterium]